MKVYSCLLSMAIFLIAGFVLASQPATTTSAPTSQQSTQPLSISEVDPKIADEIELLTTKLARDNYNATEIIPQIVKYGRSATPFLIELLEQNDPYVRMNAATTLGLIGDKSTFEPVKDLLFDYSSPETFWPRREAIRAIVLLDKQRAYEFVVKALEEDPDSENQVRLEAITLIRKNYPDKAAEPLLKIFKDETDSQTMRYFALQSVGSIQDAKVTETLLKETQSENNEFKGIAIRSLAKCQGNDVLPRLLELLKDKNDIIRGCAAYALRDRGDVKAIDELRKFVQTETSKNNRMAGLGALLVFKDQTAADELIKGLSEEDPEVCCQAAAQLGFAHEKKAIDPLIDLFHNNTDHTFHYSMAWALSQFEGEEKIFDLFVDALKENNQDTCRIATSYLAQSGNPKAIKPLLKALSNPDCTSLAAEALGDIGDQSCIRDLEIVANYNPTPYAKQAARQSIGKIKTRLAAAASKPTTASVPAN